MALRADCLASCRWGIIYWVLTDYIGGHVFEIVGWSLIVSRCTAMLMLPTFSLCLLAVCRRTMTFLRTTPLNYIIPFDDAITFHRWMGGIGAFSAVLHAVCHIANFISFAPLTH
ncbi:hypothetical protein WJX75_000312 [Coccomyxa subellipsoidea]|uniref:Ferric oxidoreductase domain-containing protein n=1 Tax=Coccomyxa subellipsoidea TaxID=248742 RepID=A0ABR2YAN1_9CHLO